jgi:hypothetical protein
MRVESLKYFLYSWSLSEIKRNVPLRLRALRRYLLHMRRRQQATTTWQASIRDARRIERRAIVTDVCNAP